MTSGTVGASGLPTDAAGTTLVFSPNVQNAALVAGTQGAIDWACASLLANTAQSRGLTNAVPGTLPARYAPSECR